MGSPWSEDNVLLLEELVAKGMSALQIAMEMGRITGIYFSRNAIIGKIYRTGFELIRMKEKYVRPPRRRTSKMSIKLKPRKLSLVELAKQVDAAPDPIIRSVTMENLAPHHCRWPSGEGAGILFCGADKVDLYPYCAHHCLRAYNRP